MRSIVFRKKKIYYSARGKGKTIVLLHGFMESSGIAPGNTSGDLWICRKGLLILMIQASDKLLDGIYNSAVNTSFL